MADQVEIPRARVWIGNVNPGQVGTDYTSSLIELALADRVNGWGCFQGILEARSGANVSKGRNEIVTRFLDKTDGEWLLFIDSDMVVPEDTIVRLLMAAQAAGTKIISGLCVMVTPDGPIPTLYLPAEEPNAVTRVMLNAPDDQVMQVFATGAACLMVHRDVLEKFRETAQGDPFCWFQEKVIRTCWVSEDITFCLRAYELGFTVFVDTTLSIGHAKYGRVWHARDIGGGVGISPAKTVAVIPTKTVDLAFDMVTMLCAQECDEIVIVDNGLYDPLGVNTALWVDRSTVPITILDGEGMGIHEMWNLGARHAIDKHGHRTRIAFLNDDLELGDGFMAELAKALDAGAPTLIAVCGNYDGREGTGIQEVTDICAGRYDGTGGFAGFAFMVRGDYFTSGYRFPEECKWWYGDNDLITAINHVPEYTAAIALDAKVTHIDGGSKTGGDWSEFADQLEADRKAYEARWAAVDWDPAVLAGVS